MELHFRIVRTTLCAALLAATLATAASADPNDPLGLGTKLGVQALNNSGQVGTITLFRRGAQRTFVDLSLSGVPAGKDELVSIRRGRDCSGAIAPAVAFALGDAHGGRSRTLSAAAEATLLSGNYSVIVASKQQPKHYLACGHLYR